MSHNRKDKYIGSHNGNLTEATEVPFAVVFHSLNLYLVITTCGCPLFCLLVALDSWQTLALSSVIIDPSIKHFDVAHVSTAATSNFSMVQDFCLQGKGIPQRGYGRALAKYYPVE